MKEVFNNYIEDRIQLDRYQLVGIFCLIVVISW